jgi:hypothetical protein
MAESFLIFIAIIVGIAVLLVIFHYMDVIVLSVVGVLLAVALIALFVGGLALLVNVGGFPGAVGIFMMLPGVLVISILSIAGVSKIKERK